MFQEKVIVHIYNNVHNFAEHYNIYEHFIDFARYLS